MTHYVRSHGLANDYIVMDPKDLPFELTPDAVRLICDRNRGVGSDGILLVSPGQGADFGVRILNPDGSEAEKSGNGLRIFARYLWDTGRVSDARFVIETKGGLAEASVTPGAKLIRVGMGQASFDSQVVGISGPRRGPQIAHLCTATTRAVAQGVVGIAFIQMLLIGVGFAVMGIPGAGLLALAVLLLGIMQLPTSLITLPVIVFVFVTQGATLATIVFAIYVFLAGLSDNVLKPLLLGRGVDVPMPVVLLGALGGMVTDGIIGLFIGPVVLAVGYQLFWQWVEDQPHSDGTVEPTQT